MTYRIFLFCLLTISVGTSQDPPTVYRDLDYVGMKNPRQTLDLYLPAATSESPRPLIVFVHGGAWRLGSKAGGGRRLQRFLDSGNYVGASINYRLTPEALWPAQIHDCRAAIRWLRGNAEMYGIDPKRIAVWGTSAGGHLVAMLGTSHGVEGLEGDLGEYDAESSAVQAVVNFFGPANLATMGDHPSTMDHNAPNSPESLLIGGPVQDTLSKAAEASPETHATPDDSPMLIVHGTEDELVPYPQSVEFEKALEKAGVPVSFLTVEKGGHGRGFGPDVDAVVERFLANQLLGEGPLPEDQTVPAVLLRRP